jgi:hypothetical protein
MLKLLGQIGIVILTVFLSLGWKWAEILVERGLITQDDKLTVVIAITAALAIYQTFLVIPKPAKFGAIEGRKVIIEKHLDDLLNHYYAVLAACPGYNPNNALPIVRVNLMLPTKIFYGIFGCYLKIYYYSCPLGILYNDNELILHWRKKKGTCGWAWSQKRISYYDSVDPNLQIPSKRIPIKFVPIIQNTKSVISVPVVYKDDIIGILNLDSPSNVSDTKYNLQQVSDLVYIFGLALSGVCFEHGVEG